MIKKFLKDKRVIFAVLGIVLVLLLVDFNQRMTLLTRLRREEKELTEYYSQLESTRTALEAELIYAQSDQAVERWAREDAMMIQPGDIPIVLLPPAEQVPTPSIIEPVIIEKIKKWEIWQALFLGD
ncbi:MAG: septum formation initiator family protein [Anaerolineaceae bacterium]